MVGLAAALSLRSKIRTTAAVLTGRYLRGERNMTCQRSD